MLRNTHIQLERIFKSVANRRRVVILRYLQTQKQATVGNISEHIKLSLSATSRHLDILKRADFLVEHQQGLEVYHRINRECKPITRRLLQMII